jgi:hypothetical protein
MPINAPIIVSPQAVGVRNWIKTILGVGVSYADGLRTVKHPNGGVNYCWVVRDVKPETLANITELAELAKGHPNISIKINTIASGCKPGKAYQGGIYVRCKVYA